MKLPFLGHGAWRVAGVLLPFLLWCGVAVATTVNSVTVTNHATNPSYVIASDAATGGNRHQIQASAQINCTEGGDYQITWALIDADDAVKVSTQTTFSLILPQLISRSGNLDPNETAPLDPQETYRLKVTVTRDNGTKFVPVGTLTETVGRRYIHFTSINSGDGSDNIYGELTGAAIAKRWAVSSISGGANQEDNFSVEVDYQLHRFDRWTAGVVSSVNVQLAYEVHLFAASTNTEVPLASQTVTDPVPVSVAAFNPTIPRTPALVTGTSTLHFKPAAQINSVAETYYAVVKEVQVMDDWTSPIATETNAAQTAAQRLMHFSGTVRFSTIATTLVALTDAAVSGVPTGTYVPVTLEVPANGAHVNGFPAYTWGGTRALRLLANGDATYHSGTDVPLSAPAVSAGVISGVRFTRSGLFLDSGGLFADLRITLPSGVGYRSNLSSSVYSRYLEIADVELAQDLSPDAATATFVPATTPIYVSEESKPLVFSANTLVWNVDLGTFGLTSPSAVPVRDSHLEYLRGVRPLLANEAKDLKRSNDHFYNAVTSTVASVEIGVNAAGGGTLTTEMTLGPTNYVTHMPYGTTIFGTGGSVAVSADQINSFTSRITGVKEVGVPYVQECSDPKCAPAGTPAAVNQRLSLTVPELQISPSGALRGTGSTLAADPIAWGKDSTGAFAHQLEQAFSDATFLAADTFLLGAANPSDGAGIIFNTGYNTSGGLLVPESPETGGYALGAGDYPGLNYRCSAGGFSGKSLLGGTLISYPLKTRAKYYTRISGVTGIHDAASIPDPTQLIYGYHFNFSNFGLSFLSSLLDESRINGNIDFDGPSNFVQDFEELRLTCLGDLTSLIPVGTLTKELEHWNCLIRVVAARFAGEDSESCAAGEPRTYLTSVRTGASHVPDSLFADLGLMPDGNIVRPADNRKDEDKLITSRFRLPNKIEIQGPSNAGGTGETEVWAFTPVQEAYLSHYDATDAKGYWSMFGTIDAPFFEDVSVQMHTSATGGDYSSPLYMMGGWPAQGWHIDAKTPLEVATFDPSHSGRPADVPTASYRDTTTASTYRPRAEQTWADLIDFGYEMNWDSTRRTFESVEANNDVMVVNIANQIAHLSPGYVELDFGFSYDGLPKINLTQAAYNAVDASTGVANSLVQATSQAAFDALTDGTDRLAKMVGDRMDLVFDETIEGLIDASVDQLMVDLGVTFQATGSIDTARMRDAVSDAFDRAGGIVDQLQQLAASGTAATTMVDQITTNLNRVLQALDTCVRLQRYGEVDSGTLADLFDVANDAYDDPNENALEDFAERLVFDLSAEITSDILNQVWASLLEEHGDKITAAEVALSEVYTEIKAIVTQLSNATSDINQELKAILTAASVAGGEIDTAMDAAEEDILDLILDLSTMDVSVSAWTTVSVDLDLRFREAIKARIYNCEFVTDISTTLKQFLFDLEARMASAIDSGFDALNDILRDAISGYLSGIDEEINGLLGDQLDNYVGAGQVAGYARITGDSLEVLRLDGKFQWKVPEPMEFEAYLEIKSHDSLGNSSCRGAGAGDVTEVIIGANRVPVDWISPDLKANVSTKFSFDGSGTPIGIGGQFEMQGELTYETFVITELGAAVAFGQNEAYLAAEVGLRFSSYELSGGIFFGKSCSIDPLKLIDPDVASLLDGASSFTGAYAYGEAWMPIIGSSCVFNVSAGVGAGVFYFAEGPTFGGKMLAGVSGEALCAVSVKGEIEMIGLKQGDAYKFSGTGRISGKAGSCPFCIKFRESVKLTYEDGSWDVDF